MAAQIKLGDIAINVVLKDIKHVHLSVHPPAGRVTISAPRRMRLDTLRVFTISRLGWIKRQQKKLRSQERETPREYLERESHYVWGKRYLLKVVEEQGPPKVELRHSKMLLRVASGTDEETKEAIVAQWYREQVKAAMPDLIAKWTPLIETNVDRVFVQKMKTKWGSCNPSARTIRLNTELAKKPLQCLEYVVVHEMVHFLEPTHNSRFVQLMDRLLPQWRVCRQRLNELPVRHEQWTY